MLDDFGIFLVLTAKVCTPISSNPSLTAFLQSLFAYHIEPLVSSFQREIATQTPQKLDGNVHFFSVGSLLGRTMVIFKKRQNTASFFRVVEPIVDRTVRLPTGVGSWFRNYRELNLLSDSFDAMLLENKIAILCTKGFEFMYLPDFKRMTIPQREDSRLADLIKRCEACRPLGMFRSTNDEFLLCYNEFGLYVDGNGDPSPSRPIGTIEWEGNAERVAFHAPYVLLFDNRFIEVRHVETGRLAQIIPGTDVHCSWDGRSRASDSNEQNVAEHRNQEARVHAVMNAPEPPVQLNQPVRAITQRVSELVPTIPTTMTYFTPSSRTDDQ
ncbi:CNH domain-containing protein [Mycena maculata]|uniref:CNH domain-containing protein n=1 Tax=Mycena maculata TaxID=230809 RepID=A0AAD7JY41_9AGAR|nr:CNH domain-containing protein [Mycena maculata]